jgi:hypothetical protein
MKTVSLHCAISCVLLLAFGPSFAQADLVFESGSVVFAQSGTQFGRLLRNGTPSDWSAPEPFPGVLGAPTARAYEKFTLNVGPYSFIQISLDDPTFTFFDAAYLGSYNPVNVGPNYGLDVNYLGDAGFSGDVFGNPTFFQIQVPVNSNLVVVLNEVDPDTGAGKNFDLLVEGFIDANFDGVPEPSPILPLGILTTLLVLVSVKRRAI